MADTLPYLRLTSGGLNAQCLFPFERTLSFQTNVQQFWNAAEQRWPTRPGLYDFSLPFSNLLTADKNAWVTFFSTVLGRKATDLQITLVNPVLSTTTVYNNLCLMSDSLNQTNPNDVLYNFQVRLRQASGSNGTYYSTWAPPSAVLTSVGSGGGTATYAYSSSSVTPYVGMLVTVLGFSVPLNNISTPVAVTAVNPGVSFSVTATTQVSESHAAIAMFYPGSFPTFSFGGVAEQPYSQIYTYLTSVSDSTYGPRYDYQWYGSGLGNMPTGYLKAWRISYPLLTDADMATLEAFFGLCQGRYLSFQFTDPIDGSVNNHVRFDSDSIVMRYITRNQNSTEITLRQTLNS